MHGEFGAGLGEAGVVPPQGGPVTGEPLSGGAQTGRAGDGGDAPVSESKQVLGEAEGAAVVVEREGGDGQFGGQGQRGASAQDHGRAGRGQPGDAGGECRGVPGVFGGASGEDDSAGPLALQQGEVGQFGRGVPLGVADDREAAGLPRPVGARALCRDPARIPKKLSATSWTRTPTRSEVAAASARAGPLAM